VNYELVLATISLLITSVLTAITLRSRMPADKAEALAGVIDGEETAWDLAEKEAKFLVDQVKKLNSRISDLEGRLVEMEARALAAERKVGTLILENDRLRDALKRARNGGLEKEK
jgi:hypothetical protein